MKILYTGPCRPGSVTESRRRACVALGHDVVALDQAPYIDPYPSFLRRLQLHSLIGPGIVRYNRDIVAAAVAARPDLIYIDQAAYLNRATAQTLANIAPLVHYTSEHLGFRTYWYRHLRRTANLFAAHVITNELAAPILRSWGAKRILFTQFGFDPVDHAPPMLTEDESRAWLSDAVFVGHWEPATEEAVARLRASGLKVAVWGKGWARARSLSDRDQIAPVSVADYPKAIGGAKLALCFLSKWNRNTTAGRTFEIPAIGGFLLAERTPEHLSLFQEGAEAEFFSSPEELAAKAKSCLADEKRRAAIAAAGRRRCLSSGYSNVERMRVILKELSAFHGSAKESLR